MMEGVGARFTYKLLLRSQELRTKKQDPRPPSSKLAKLNLAAMTRGTVELVISTQRHKRRLTGSESLPPSTEFVTLPNIFMTSSYPAPKSTMTNMRTHQSQSQNESGDAFSYNSPIVKDYESGLEDKPVHSRGGAGMKQGMERGSKA